MEGSKYLYIIDTHGGRMGVGAYLFKHTSVKVLILTGIFLVIIVTYAPEGSEGISSSSPFAVPSYDYSYYDQLYYTDFYSHYDIDIGTGGDGESAGGAGSPYLYLYSPEPGDTATASPRYSYVDGSDITGHGVYYVGTRFKPLSENYYGWDSGIDGNYFMVLGRDVGLYLKDHRELCVRRPFMVGPGAVGVDYENNPIMTLDFDQEYLIEMWIHNDGGDLLYDIYIDGDYKRTVTTDYLFVSPLTQFGDYDSFDDSEEPMNARGIGQWESFEIRGHSESRFFDNFNDGNPFNWNNIVRTPTDLAEFYVTNQDELKLSSFDPADPDDPISCANTPFIDYYDTQQDYIISFDFRFSSEEDWFVVMSNTELVITLKNTKLQYMMMDQWYIQAVICDVIPNTQYYIEIFKDASEMEWWITVNGIEYGPKTTFNDRDDGTPYLEIGDSSHGTMRNHGAFWDDVRVFSDAIVNPSGFTPGFHLDNHILTYVEDFEDYDTDLPGSQDIEERGWFTDTHSEGSNDAIWDVAWLGLLEPHTGENCIVTINDGNYPNNADESLISPPFFFENFDSAEVSFWLYYDTEQGRDGLQFEYRVFPINGQWDDWDDVDNTIYNTLNVPVFNNEAAFTDNSGGWVRIEISLTNLLQINQQRTYQFRFCFRSDGGNTAFGVAIDDFKVHGMRNEENNMDLDGDGITNHVEYFIFKCSPLLVDTDQDALDDNIEISHPRCTQEIVSYFEFNPADPCYLDAILEIDHLSGARYISSEFKDEIDGIVSQFKDHRINLHVLYDGTNLAFDDGDDDKLSDAELDQIKIDHCAPNDRQVVHYCLIATRHEDSTFHWFWEPDGVLKYGRAWDGISAPSLAIFTDDIETKIFWTLGVGDDDYEEYAVKTFQHELGHTFGLLHYKDAWNTWKPNEPTNNAMKSGFYNYRNYQRESSNTEYSWESSGNPRSGWFGGWEWSCDDQTGQTHTEWTYYRKGGSPWGPRLFFPCITYG